MAVGSADRGAAVRAPARLTVMQSVQRNLGLAVMPVIALLAVAVAVGLARTPVYSSDAQLNVGGVNLTIQSIPGYSLAVQQLATTYARTIDASAVIDPVARRLRMSPQAVANDVSATPVQGSPVIVVRAQAADAQTAERLADAVSSSLASYAGKLNRSNPDTSRLLRAYLADSEKVRAAQSALSAASSAGERKRASAAYDVARLKQQADGLLFQQSKAGGAATSFVQKLAPASAASSDRASLLQRLVAAALIAGALIGVGLALLRTQRDLRRPARP